MLRTVRHFLMSIVAMASLASQWASASDLPKSHRQIRLSQKVTNPTQFLTPLPSEPQLPRWKAPLFPPPIAFSSVPQAPLQIADQMSMQAPIAGPKLLWTPDVQLKELKVSVPQAYLPERLRDFTESTPAELLYLRALIEFEVHKNYPFALGAFALLSKDPKIGTDAELYYGLVSLKAGLYQEATQSFLKVAKTKPELKLEIAKLLASQDLIWPKTFLPKAIVLFDIEQTQLGPRLRTSLLKFFMESGDLNQASLLIGKLSQTELDKDLDARYLKAVIEYRRGQISQSMETLQAIDPLKRNDQINVLLARLYFQSSQFAKSVSTYQLVSNLSPEYLDSLIELGWAQLLGTETKQAIGNMTMLQNKLFEQAVSPDSHLVSTSGYLNYCQYGDALRAILEMQKKYKPYLAALEQISQDPEYNPHKDLNALMSGKKSILAPNLLVELARSTAYKELEADIKILTLEDQKFARIVTDVIQQEGALQNRVKLLSDPIELSQQNEALASLRSARKLLSSARKTQVARLRNEVASLQAMQTQQLRDEMVAVSAELKTKLADSERLKYEIFAGAGTHLRKLLGGEELTTEKLASLPKQKVQWSFNNEIWMDEIGNFQSEITDACPKKIATGGI